VGSGSSGTMRNNILKNFSARAINVDTASSGTEDYNIYNLSGPNYGVTRGAHSLTSDPMFVSAIPSTANDVKLKTGSPAINSGMVLASPFNWALNPQNIVMPYATVDQNTLGAWERGAFAFGTSSTVNSLPTADS